MITYFPHIFFPGKFVGAAFCEKDYLAEVKRLKIENPLPFVLQAASVKRYYKKNSSEITFIICFDAIKNKHFYKNEVAALICHEAVHISDWIFEDIGEDKVGMETRAYLVQYIVWQTLNALDEFMKRKRK